jgi:hypothetical protein
VIKDAPDPRDPLEQLELLATLARTSGLTNTSFSVDSDGYFTAHFPHDKTALYYNFDHAVKSIHNLRTNK